MYCPCAESGNDFSLDQAYSDTGVKPSQFALIAVAAILVLVCALLTGLTLAVCGLDINLLQMRTVAGNMSEKQQARRVMRMKRRANWMLGSLTLCSVACSQTLPFVIQRIWEGPETWVPILISTLIMTVFAEIIPQSLVPQQAISWGYFCSLLIWGCMWSTCLITYPLGWLLDSLRIKKDRVGIFTNAELYAVIHYHQQAGKHGGKLGHDAARIMLGALELDSQRLSGDKKHASQSANFEQDVEKADSVTGEELIVKWSAVKTIDMNDTVDEAFVRKVQSWSYSRIPVISKVPATSNDDKDYKAEGWEGGRVFGFLHVKNLVGLDTKLPAKTENQLKVKDLRIYPLPIVRADMSVYELLNLFQLGMSRMAVVVRESSAAGDGKNGSTRWTATERSHTHLMSNLDGAKFESDWARDYMKFAQEGLVEPDRQWQNVLGIECPQPLGIITFEDIIDTILQKTSRDERDFFDRNCSRPPTKKKKVGDHFPGLDARVVERNLPRSPKRAHVTFEKSVNHGTIRKRKVSHRYSGHGGLDGADDRSSDGCCASSIRLPKNRRKSTGSSYTDNSRGGFHGVSGSGSAAMDHAILMTPEEIIELANTSSSDCPGNPYSHVKTASLPTRESDPTISEESKGYRNISASPRLPQLRRVAPFSRDNPSSIDREGDDQESEEMTKLKMPTPITAPGPLPAVDLQLRYNPNISGIVVDEMEDLFEATDLQAHVRERSGETVSLISWSSEDDTRQTTCVYDAFPVSASEPSLLQRIVDAVVEEKGQTKPYDGFPPELLDIKNKENRHPDYASKTLPRSIGTELHLEGLAEKTRDGTPPARESSFHDDRALLPSQRRLLENSSTGLGVRSSSLWF